MNSEHDRNCVCTEQGWQWCMHRMYASADVFRRASMSPCKVVVIVAGCEWKLVWTGSFS